MRRIVLAIGLIACSQVTKILPIASAPTAACQPTIARMVPPQQVMDAIFAGMNPQPRSTPSVDAWAATENWIGSDALWISLPADGVYERKFHKLWATATRIGRIDVTGHLVGEPTSTRIGSMEAGSFGSSIDFAETGCWEVTYFFDGAPLRFTLKVVD